MRVASADLSSKPAIPLRLVRVAPHARRKAALGCFRFFFACFFSRRNIPASVRLANVRRMIARPSLRQTRSAPIASSRVPADGLRKAGMPEGEAI